MKRAALFGAPLFWALLFFYAAPAHSMGLIRALKKLVQGSKRELQRDPAEAQVGDAFSKTSLPSELLAIILGYCPQKNETVFLKTITLPDASKGGRYPFNYPKHSAVRVSLEGFRAKVLDTRGVLLTYDLRTGELVSEKASNVRFGEFHCLNPYLEKKPPLRWWIPKDGDGYRVWIADGLINDSASNERFEVRIVGKMSDLGRKIAYKLSLYGDHGIRIVHNEPAGHSYYDPNKEPDPYYKQSRTTIEIYEKCEPAVIARILNLDIPEHENSGHENHVKENSEGCEL